MFSALETRTMAELIQKAGEFKGKTASNPMVGAAVLKDDKVVSMGFHERFGGPHAEVNAISNAGEATKGATLLITLEPCTHHGKTPPCTDGIIASGIKNVIYAASDPNPKVKNAADILARHGITVQSGLLASQSMALNRVFHFAMAHRQAFFTLKMAFDAKGNTIPPQSNLGSRNTFTAHESLMAAHRLRREHQGILVGKNTVIHDDPMLDVRYDLGEDGYENPTVILLAKQEEIPTTAALFQRRPESQVLYYGGWSWEEMAHDLFERGIHSVLIEGGRTVAKSALEHRIVNYAHFFTTPHPIQGATGYSDIWQTPLLNEAHMQHGPDTERLGVPNYQLK